MTGERDWEPAVAAYVTGRLSVAKAAKEHGVPERPLREVLRGRGLLRNVGQQRLGLDATKIWELRKKRRLSWAQIAAGLDASENAVQNAYRAAYGDDGEIDPYAHLTGVQAAELGHMWDKLPRNAGGHDTHCQEARRLLQLVAFHHKRGVTIKECAEAIGADMSYLAGLLRDRLG